MKKANIESFFARLAAADPEPKGELNYSNTYTLLVDSGFLDATGLPMVEEFRKTFRVVEPVMTRVDPAGWTIDPPRAGSRQPLVVRLPRSMDNALLGRMIWVVDSQGREVTGAVVVQEEETRWAFMPDADWQAGNHELVMDTTMEDVSGQLVRKWGLHRPSAIVLWKSMVCDLQPPPPGSRLLGSAIYFPKLQLNLPWFLPDLGFDDLRRFDFPQPLLTLEGVLDIRDRDLDWLRVEDNLRFAADWEGDGDVPRFVSERFPDH